MQMLRAGLWKLLRIRLQQLRLLFLLLSVKDSRQDVGRGYETAAAAEKTVVLVAADGSAAADAVGLDVAAAVDVVGLDDSAAAVAVAVAVAVAAAVAAVGMGAADFGLSPRQFLKSYQVPASSPRM